MNNPHCAADKLGCVNATKRNVITISRSADTIARALADASAASRALAADQHPLSGINDQTAELDRVLAEILTQLDELQARSLQLVATACGEHYAAALAAQSERAEAPATAE